MNDPTPDELKQYLPESIREYIGLHVDRRHLSPGEPDAVMIRMDLKFGSQAVIEDQMIANAADVEWVFRDAVQHLYARLQRFIDERPR